MAEPSRKRPRVTASMVADTNTTTPYSPNLSSSASQLQSLLQDHAPSAASSSTTVPGRSRVTLRVTPTRAISRELTCPGAPIMTGRVAGERARIVASPSTNDAPEIKSERAVVGGSGVIEIPGSQEPQAPQADGQEQGSQPPRRVINVYGDEPEAVIINFRYYSSDVEPVVDTPPMSVLNDPFLRLRVSLVALSTASKNCLRPILTSEPQFNVFQRVWSSTAAKESWTWLNQESPDRITVLICAAAHPRIPRALIHLADILHFNYSTLQYAPLPSVMVTTAEAGLAFGALGAVMPWVSAWIGEYQKAVKWPDFNCPAAGGIRYPWPEEAGPGEMMLLSMIMGDSGKFRRCSKNYIEEVLPTERQPEDSFPNTSLGLVRLIENDAQKERKIVIKLLISAINRTFTEYCSLGTSLQKVQTTQMSGALVQSIMSMWKISCPLPETWHGSITELNTRISRIHQDLVKAWEQVSRDHNSGPPALFAKKMQKIKDEMRGLELDKYRPGCVQVMDVESGTLVAGGGVAQPAERISREGTEVMP